MEGYNFISVPIFTSFLLAKDPAKNAETGHTQHYPELEREKTCSMKTPLKDILVVEDSKIFAHAITARIEADLGCRFHLAAFCKEARHLLRQKGGDLFAAVLDLVLPDASRGEVVDFALEKNIPAIVLTSEFSETVREEFMSRDIVD